MPHAGPDRTQTRVRTRDPERGSRILAAAANLVARKGFHAVSVAETAAAAGITGSGIYRHCDRKTAVLVAIQIHGGNGLSAEYGLTPLVGPRQ